MTDSKIADPAPTNEERIRNRCQHACFTVEPCRPGASDACPMCRVADSYAEMLAALKELRALVRGECPSLLNEDSGGDARLDLAIEAAIANAEGRALLQKAECVEGAVPLSFGLGPVDAPHLKRKGRR